MSKKRLSDEAIALLRAAVKRAQDNYRGFDMTTWVSPAVGRMPEALEPICGTVGCLAFEICVVAGIPPKDLIGANVEGRASEFLGSLGCYYDERLYELFRISRWPRDLAAAYETADQFSYERTVVLAEAVERWIANDGSFEE